MKSLPDILTDEFFRFVMTHSSDNADRLRLSCYGKELPFPSEIAINQTEARQKVRKKLPAIYECEKFFFPSVVLAEQCTSEALAAIHADICKEKGRVLDMTGGLGIDAFALAKYAKDVTAVELNPLAAEAGNYNTELLGLRNIRFIQGDSVEYLRNSTRRFDLIFADPARRVGGNRVYSFLDCLPNISENIGQLKTHSDRLLLKGSPMLDITDTIRLFPGTEEVWILSTRNECKEIVININLAVEKAIITKIIALNLTADSIQRFEYFIDESDNDLQFVDSVSELCNMVREGRLYLYEPNASLMKCSPWGNLNKVFPQIKKLSANTHLFVSPHLYEAFPGKITEILSVALSKSEISKLKKIKANVVTRNYTVPADTLRKQLKIADGGKLYIYGCRVGPSPILIHSQLLK